MPLGPFPGVSPWALGTDLEVGTPRSNMAGGSSSEQALSEEKVLGHPDGVPDSLPVGRLAPLGALQLQERHREAEPCRLSFVESCLLTPLQVVGGALGPEGGCREGLQPLLIKPSSARHASSPSCPFPQPPTLKKPLPCHLCCQALPTAQSGGHNCWLRLCP